MEVELNLDTWDIPHHLHGTGNYVILGYLIDELLKELGLEFAPASDGRLFRKVDE